MPGPEMSQIPITLAPGIKSPVVGVNTEAPTGYYSRKHDALLQFKDGEYVTTKKRDLDEAGKKQLKELKKADKKELKELQKKLPKDFQGKIKEAGYQKDNSGKNWTLTMKDGSIIVYNETTNKILSKTTIDENKNTVTQLYDDNGQPSGKSVSRTDKSETTELLYDKDNKVIQSSHTKTNDNGDVIYEETITVNGDGTKTKIIEDKAAGTIKQYEIKDGKEQLTFEVKIYESNGTKFLESTNYEYNDNGKTVIKKEKKQEIKGDSVLSTTITTSVNGKIASKDVEVPTMYEQDTAEGKKTIAGTKLTHYRIADNGVETETDYQIYTGSGSSRKLKESKQIRVSEDGSLTTSTTQKYGDETEEVTETVTARDPETGEILIDPNTNLEIKKQVNVVKPIANYREEIVVNNKTKEKTVKLYDNTDSKKSIQSIEKYDDKGNLIESDKTITEKVYGENNQLTQEVTTREILGEGSQIKTVEYDSEGKIKQTTIVNKDAKGNVTSQQTIPGNSKQPPGGKGDRTNNTGDDIANVPVVVTTDPTTKKPTTAKGTVGGIYYNLTYDDNGYTHGIRMIAHESIKDVCDRYGVTPEQLAKANPGLIKGNSGHKYIPAGAQIIIPKTVDLNTQLKPISDRAKALATKNGQTFRADGRITEFKDGGDANKATSFKAQYADNGEITVTYGDGKKIVYDSNGVAKSGTDKDNNAIPAASLPKAKFNQWYAKTSLTN